MPGDVARRGCGMGGLNRPQVAYRPVDTKPDDTVGIVNAGLQQIERDARPRGRRELGDRERAFGVEFLQGFGYQRANGGGRLADGGSPVFGGVVHDLLAGSRSIQ